MPIAALLLTAGQGTRMQDAVEDKILMPLAGQPVLNYSVQSFIKSETVSELVFVYRDKQQKKAIESVLPSSISKYQVAFVKGGEERQDSVFNGLSQVSLVNDYVFIHDCARPLIRPETLQKLSERVRKERAVSVARPVTDTIKRASTVESETTNSYALENVDRTGLWAMETPQVFELEAILECYRRLRYNNIRVTDDTSAYCLENKSIGLLQPEYLNLKITTPSDIDVISSLLRERELVD